ncbi:hypothetical protein BRARA_K01710 [Brassica rapa]|uniref:Malectin-like domain-containing protein n=1 Tax=Brassica campestris TaxID=3711 RepID=A0A397L318_BRACM|nr:hypothetical protein BRARA_K01710 [Brassica rapa]
MRTLYSRFLDLLAVQYGTSTLWWITSRQLLLALLASFAIIQLVCSGPRSLNCGLSANEPPYTETSNALKYSSDAKFVKGGKSGRIAKDLEDDYSKPFTTLRYFPDGIQNCYNLSVTQSTRYLVRASFVYGNYDIDGLDSYPNFDLYIAITWSATISNALEDPDNMWASLQSQDMEYVTSEEIIHIAWSNTV